MTASQTTSPAAAGNPQRRKALTALAAVVVLAGGAWGVYAWLVASHYENTDNAYVQGNVIQITPQTGGTVMSILADDTDFVQAGAPLVKRLMELGFVVNCTQEKVLRFLPPLTVTPQEIDALIAALAEVLAAPPRE